MVPKTYRIIILIRMIHQHPQNNVKHCFSQLPGVERGVFEVVLVTAVTGTGESPISTRFLESLLCLFFSLVPLMICLIVSLTLEASLERVPLVLWRLCFILRFWNHTLTCLSVKSKAPAISIRRGRHKYLLKWNSFSKKEFLIFNNLLDLALLCLDRLLDYSNSIT